MLQQENFLLHPIPGCKEYAHLLKKHTEHTYMSAIYYDQGSEIKANKCKTMVTFYNTPESKILDAGNILILCKLRNPGPLHAKIFPEYLELNILHIVFLTDQSYVNVH